MKKNVLRIISLVLVTGMLFAFCACTTEINIRFVDKDGNDVSINAPAAATPVATPATTAPSQAPAAQTPAETTTEPAAAPSDTPAQVPDSTPTEAPAQSSGMPQTKEEIADFYKNAVARVKNDGQAGFTKKEWQELDAVNIGSSVVNNAVVGLAGNFMTKEDAAEDQVAEKGSDKAKDIFPNFTLTDYSQIASATCTEEGGNYVIKMVMADEDTPKKAGSMLGQVTNSILYWEDIDDTLTNDGVVSKVLKEYDNIHVIYKGYLIEATITPGGEFVSLEHTGDVDIQIGYAKIIAFAINDKSGHMINHCTYKDFNY